MFRILRNLFSATPRRAPDRQFNIGMLVSTHALSKPSWPPRHRHRPGRGRYVNHTARMQLQRILERV